ncbi:MAG: hypothetical protein K5694_00050 [Bacilli bacterium]|nr:hypothetical protein [Bacilli bacterium]
MYKVVFTHFEPNDTLYDYNTIILEEKKKVFQTFKEALHYVTVEEKRNITKKYRRMYPAGDGDYIYLDYAVRINKNRVTLDVGDQLFNEIFERYEYLIVKI